MAIELFMGLIVALFIKNFVVQLWCKDVSESTSIKSSFAYGGIHTALTAVALSVAISLGVVQYVLAYLFVEFLLATMIHLVNNSSSKLKNAGLLEFVHHMFYFYLSYQIFMIIVGGM